MSPAFHSMIHSFKHFMMAHWELIPDLHGSHCQQFSSLAAVCDVALWSFFTICDRDLVHQVCCSASIMVQSHKADGCSTQHNLPFCSDSGSNDLHQQCLASSGSAIHVYHGRGLSLWMASSKKTCCLSGES